MLSVYKNKREMPHDMEYVELNDIFFNKNTVLKLDERAKKIVEKVDGAKLLNKYKFESKFNGVTLDVDCLSTGCKTILNVLYFPDKIFCIKECGENALEILYNLQEGFIYSDYAMIPFELESVEVISAEGKKVINDYEELKEWWNNEE